MKALLVIAGILVYLWLCVVFMDWYGGRNRRTITKSEIPELSKEQSNFEVFIELLKTYGWLVVVGLVVAIFFGIPIR